MPIDSTTGTPLLAATNLSKRYRNVVALDDVSFTIHDGITGILGENGAGKSTAIKIFLGLLRPTSGVATVLGQDASRDIGVRARLGYMPEHDCLPSQVSAAEFLTHMAEVSGIPPTVARTRAADTLRHTGLFEERYRAIGGYSTGMKQRVKLAQALVHDPKLLFLDEPTNGLDPAGRDEMLALIERIGLEFGIAVIVASHLLGEIERVATWLVAFDAGKLLQTAPLASFTERTGQLLIETDEPADALAARLVARGIDARADGRMVVADLASGDGGEFGIYDAVRDETVALGLGLVRLEHRRHQLEDLFRSGGTDERVA